MRACIESIHIIFIITVLIKTLSTCYYIHLLKGVFHCEMVSAMQAGPLSTLFTATSVAPSMMLTLLRCSVNTWVNEQTLLKTVASLDLCHFCAIFNGRVGKEMVVLECLPVTRAHTRC